jgi:hypothetical protein
MAQSSARLFVSGTLFELDTRGDREDGRGANPKKTKGREGNLQSLSLTAFLPKTFET